MNQARPLDLNLLPARYRPRRIRFPVIAAVLVVIVALLGLLPVYDELTTSRSWTEHLETRLAQAQASLSQAQAEQVKLLETVGALEQQIEETQAQTAHIRAELAILGRQQTTHYSDGVAAAVATLIPRVQILRITQQGDLFTLDGEAGSQALVLDYARALQGSGQFANVRIVTMVNTDPLGIAPDVEFSIEMEQ